METEKILSKEQLSREDLIHLLKDRDQQDSIFRKAYSIKRENVGNKVYFRGIIELSNICSKDCLYCGIRKSNGNVERYTVPDDEVLAAAKWAFESGYGSMVLQSGERSDREFVDKIEKLLKGIKRVSDNKLGITLSLGEQTYETYKRWFDAGAHRYLLRIETSNRDLYSKLHPADHYFDKRVECLSLLRKAGYQVGTGVMIGLPSQAEEDLADDILFFRDNDIDMIGMGPYIPHEDTPMCNSIPDYDKIKDRQFDLALRMIAVTRIMLRDVNIASTTALQALKWNGRELGLQAGANIIMPNITDVKYRKAYKLYENKPCTDENAEDCVECLGARIKSIGEEIGYNHWGDSPHFTKKETIDNQ